MTVFLNTVESNVATGAAFHRVSDGTNAVEYFAGTGSPEGVVVASPGSVFTDYSSGTIYRKQTGTGNAGWVEASPDGYDIVDNLAARPVASTKPDGYRVRVQTNNLTYVVQDGAYVLENVVTRIPGSVDLGARSELVEGQVFYIGSLKASFQWNGTSFEQVGCCQIDGEGPRIIADFPAPSTITAIAGESYDADTLTVQYSSGSFPSVGETLNLLRYTLTVSDPGQANDGRVIVVEAGSHAAAPAVISDTGGTPAARLTTPQLSGTGESWSFVAGVANDFIVSSAGSVSLTLLVQDTAANTDSVTL